MKITKSRGVAVVAIGGVGYALVAALSLQKETWEIGYGQGGFKARLNRVPAWASLTQDALDAVPCFHPKSDWPWKVGFGDEEDGVRQYSLGAFAAGLCEVKSMITERFGANLAVVPIDRQTARTLSPEWVDECERIFDAIDDNARRA